MGNPAARQGDQGSPPHAPTALAPGVGSLDVKYGGKPAWRCNLDTHVCSTPIAPPAPAPHGPEKCYFGSLSVMVNGQMAVRQGDKLVAAAPPNTIMLGLNTVKIGDLGFGLADRRNMAEFCRGFAELMNDWENLTPDERADRLADLANQQLGRSGVPAQSVAGSASHAPGNAQYNFTNDTIEVSQQTLNAQRLSQAEARSLANNVYHEARHAEQWNAMARRAAGQGQTAAQIQSGMGVTPSAAQSAASNPLTGTSARGNLANASHESVYGSRGAYRNEVLDQSNIQSRYEEYRALPEEQDAWATGDGLPCG